MTQAIIQTYNTASINRTKITGIIIAFCLSMAIYYGFNVYTIISKTISIQRNQVVLSKLSSEVGTLNSQYLQLSTSVTPDKLKDYGLIQSHVSQYISRNAISQSVALARH